MAVAYILGVLGGEQRMEGQSGKREDTAPRALLPKATAAVCVSARAAGGEKKQAVVVPPSRAPPGQRVEIPTSPGSPRRHVPGSIVTAAHIFSHNKFILENLKLINTTNILKRVK
jgi:hypothetical protein